MKPNGYAVYAFMQGKIFRPCLRPVQHVVYLGLLLNHPPCTTSARTNRICSRRCSTSSTVSAPQLLRRRGKQHGVAFVRWFSDKSTSLSLPVPLPTSPSIPRPSGSILGSSYSFSSPWSPLHRRCLSTPLLFLLFFHLLLLLFLLLLHLMRDDGREAVTLYIDPGRDRRPISKGQAELDAKIAATTKASIARKDMSHCSVRRFGPPIGFALPIPPSKFSSSIPLSIPSILSPLSLANQSFRPSY